MGLVDKQSRFTECVAILLAYAFKQGYQVTLGDAYRDPRVPYGHMASCHRKRLAIDLNIFKDGRYLQANGEYDDLGIFWESLDPMASWGGRFGDDGHFSFEHNGIK